jgi:hypothetical protein
MTLAIRARVNRSYFLKQTAGVVLCAGAGLYCLYDGLYAYPERNRIHEQFEQFKLEHRSDWSSAWIEHARKNHLPIEPLEPKSQLSIQAQFIMAALSFAGFGFFAIAAGWCVGRWIELDGDELRTSSGQSFKMSEITKLDTERWADKGIAFVHYEQGSRTGRIRLDDYLYDAVMTKQIYSRLEASLPADRVGRGGAAR